MEQITCMNVDSFLKHEQFHMEAKKDQNLWNPLDIIQLKKCCHKKTKVQEIMNNATLYWGDTYTLQLLAQSKWFRERQIGFIVLTPDGIAYPRFIGAPQMTYQSSRAIILYYHNDDHWKLVSFRCCSSCSSPKTIFDLCATKIVRGLKEILLKSWGKNWRDTLDC